MVRGAVDAVRAVDIDARVVLMQLKAVFLKHATVTDELGIDAHLLVSLRSRTDYSGLSLPLPQPLPLPVHSR